VSSGFGELSIAANELVAAGDLAGAEELLRSGLSTADPRPTHATPELTEAAGLQARVLVALNQPHAARGWAAFAHAAATRLYGTADPRTVAAAATLAAVLHRVGSHARAAHLYRDVIIELTATDGPESLRVLAAHADLATVEYARGQCTVARTRLEEAWELHREVYGDANPAGIRMLARLGAMRRDCGQHAEARRDLDLALDLCRAHLSDEHPLAAQVAALARQAPDPDHRCADDTPAPAEEDAPAAEPSEVTGDQFPPTEPAVSATQPVASAPAHRPGYGSYAAYAGDVPAADAPPPWQDRRWPTTDAGTDGPEAGPGLPVVAPRPGTALEPAPGVRRVGRSAEPRHRARLPVTIQRPPQSRDRRMLPLVIGGVVVVVLGTVAVVAGFAMDGAPPPPDTARRPLPTSSVPPATPGTAPTGLTLTDNRDSIVLLWDYPAGADAPVVISGGRPNQEQRPFQELPAGSTSYVVHALNEKTDYCFTVAVVYSADLVGRSEQVCTQRRGSR
jgi:tetratricopeptide (TPR) repeat protein